MTDASSPSSAAGPPPARHVGEESMTMPIVVYVLFLLGYLTGGFTTLVGVVIAYVQKGDAGPRVGGHYVFAINTFWITLLGVALCTVMALVGMPMLLLHGIGIVFFMLSGLLGLIVTVWFLVRCVVGLVRAAQGEPCVTPRSWLL